MTITEETSQTTNTQNEDTSPQTEPHTVESSPESPVNQEPQATSDTEEDEISEAELINFLAQKGGFDQDSITQLISEQKTNFNQAKQIIAGHLYTIDESSRTLYIKDSLTLQDIKEVPLTDSSDPINSGDWSNWSSSYSLTNLEEGLREGLLEQKSDLDGLVVTKMMSYIYHNDPSNEEILGISRNWYNPKVHEGNSPNTLFDMFLSDDRKYLCIADREAGSLTVLSPQSNQVQGVVKVRTPGSKRALNITFDTNNNIAYLTDNQSFILYRLNMETLYLEKLDTGLAGYALGNIALSPDGENLYMLTLKPEQSLKYFNLEQMAFVKEFKMKGELYTQGKNNPVDLLFLTPYKTHLLFMTYIDEPEPFTPVITIIDTEAVKTTKRYSIKDNSQPITLVFSEENPTLEYKKSTLELLIEKGITTPQGIQEAYKEIQKNRDNLRKAEALAKINETVIDLDGPDAPEEGQGKVPTLGPVETKTVQLNPETAEAAILEILTEKLYQRFEITLDRHEEELERFKQEASKIRVFLQNHDSQEVSLENIIGEYKLSTLVVRQEVLNIIETHAIRKAIEEKKKLQPPSNCPGCDAKLMAKWDCSSCGMEVDSPPRIKKKAMSSVAPITNLAQFHIQFADPARGRLVMLDANKTLDWDLNPDKLNGIIPFDTLWLANKNLLVLDSQAGQLFECGPSGKIKWESSPEVDLNQPVKVTYFENEEENFFIVVDQGNHRVVSFDRDSTVLWSYGQKGVASADKRHLNTPSDIQRTYDGTYLITDTGNDRVIEIEGNNIIRSWGQNQGLVSPAYAERLTNGDTLIVDAGNYRVLQINSDKEVIAECFYFKEEMGSEMRIDRPTRVIRGQKKNLIIMDEERIMEVLPEKQRLIWSSLIEHLAKRLDIKGDDLDVQEQYSKSFYQHKLPDMNDMLKRLKDSNKLASSAGLAQKLMENLNKLVETRRELDLLRAEQTTVKMAEGVKLQPIPIYSVDRTYHQVVQIDRKGTPQWYFCNHPNYPLLRPAHVTQTENSLLIADNGNKRILEVNKETKEVMLCIGSKTDRKLNQPRSAFRMLSGNTLVADQGNRRLVEFDSEGNEIWEFKNPREVSSPYYAMELGTGNILFVDNALQMVKEITKKGQVIWAYGQSRRVGKGPNQLSSPEYAFRLPNGATLIADARNNRVIEVAPTLKILWGFRVSRDKTYELESPTFCQRLAGGNTLIAHDNYRKLVEVDRKGHVRWEFELGQKALIR